VNFAVKDREIFADLLNVKGHKKIDNSLFDIRD